MNDQNETPDEATVSEAPGRDHRLEAVILQYLKAADAGRPLDRRQLREQYPDLSDALRDFFAEQDAVEAVLPPAGPAPTLPARVGHCEILGELGRGGMGAVLKGRDTDLNRDVAVKVLLEAHRGKDDYARRFVEEAQIAGQLQHPGVTPVYELGTFPDQRPYFTMKLVKGQTLTALLAARTDPAEEQTKFIGVFAQVCQAVAYAHARGVIHRDLKPGNVMVGAFGEVQVMDWGLAKVLRPDEGADRPEPEDAPTAIRTMRSAGSGTDEAAGSDTRAGSVLGTPAYMAPEQARGDVSRLDERCDVFGLGAILCQVLTGKPAYTGRSGEEVYRKAKDADTAEALARLDGCGADAELIELAKQCLTAEPAERPRNAGELAEAVTAYQESVTERLRQAELERAAETARAGEAMATAAQERRARRLTLGLAATVLLAVTLGGSAWQWLKAERDAHQAQLTRGVNDALNRATALRERAKAAPVGGAALFAQAREQAQRALALVQSGLADAVLAAQVQHLQTELDEEEKDRTLLAALDAAWLAQAETLSENRFAPERAVPLFREALRAYGLPAGEGEPGAAAGRIRGRPAVVREALVAALDHWTDLATDPNLELTEPHLDWLKAVAEATRPVDSWARQFRAARVEKDTAKRRAALERLAEAADVQKLPAPALRLLADQLKWLKAGASAVRLLRRAQERYPADFWVNHNLGVALQEVTPPEWEEAVRFLTAAVALRPDSPGAHYNLGRVLQRKGRMDEAIACYHQALALNSKYAAAHANLGVALSDKGKLDEAITEFRAAIALEPKSAEPHNGLGVALYGKGQLDDATTEYRTAIALDPKFAAPHQNLGAILCNVKHDYDEAIREFRLASKLDPKGSSAHLCLGIALQAKGQLDEAIREYHTALALDPKYAQARSSLARAETMAKRLADFDLRAAAILKGKAKAKNSSELLKLGRFCLTQKKATAAAARLYADAFTAELALADDLHAGDRYAAARAAALAGCGKGRDAADLDEPGRARWRKQALDWLRADLQAWAKRLDGADADDRAEVRTALQRWQRDPDLAGLRDTAALEKLPETERAAWRGFWKDVTALVEKARS